MLPEQWKSVLNKKKRTLAGRDPFADMSFAFFASFHPFALFQNPNFLFILDTNTCYWLLVQEFWSQLIFYEVRYLSSLFRHFLKFDTSLALVPVRSRHVWCKILNERAYSMAFMEWITGVESRQIPTSTYNFILDSYPRSSFSLPTILSNFIFYILLFSQMSCPWPKYIYLRLNHLSWSCLGFYGEKMQPLQYLNITDALMYLLRLRQIKLLESMTMPPLTFRLSFIKLKDWPHIQRLSFLLQVVGQTSLLFLWDEMHLLLFLLLFF